MFGISNKLLIGEIRIMKEPSHSGVYSTVLGVIFIFMAHRAFPRVRCMFIYIYVCVTCASMRCIRS